MSTGIGAGHGGNDPGAVSQGNIERDLNRVMTSYMISMARAAGATIVDLTVDEGYPYNIDGPIGIANSAGVSLAIQNHFNAGGGNGCEVLYWGNDEEARKKAVAASAAISAAYGLFNRGAKARGTDLGFLRDTNMTSLIIEWGFVDAPGNSDVPVIMADPAKGAAAVLGILGIADTGGGGGVPAPAPAPTPQPQPAPQSSGTVVYEVHTDDGWLGAVSKVDDTEEGYAGYGSKPIDGIRAYRADGNPLAIQTHSGGHWHGGTTFVGSLWGENESGDGYSGNIGGGPITGIRVWGADVRVDAGSGYYGWLSAGETPEGDDFAGDLYNGIVAVQMK
jgi:N-acetylmuramoyl-L-alanine amidase